ncbi:MAG: transglycosylase SLT domain-containing protein [Acidobacteriota bacterium]|nr:transglycosylase SLT domain-containing protein [Acidobacteriota bacterium]
MKFSKILSLCLAITIFSISYVGNAGGQTPSKPYQQMTRDERSAFVASAARRIAREMSGSDYEFTPAFEEDIQQAVNQYARRIGNGTDRLGKGDVRFVFERGHAHAPALMAAFQAHKVSPLIALYLPMIESEFVNLQSPNSMGSIGMFQFLPKTGEKYGLSPQELLDVNKAADAAARYIVDSLETFKNDPMKEALALLAYNRGGGNTARDLKLIVNEQNKQCSVCALSAQRSKLDDTFRSESVFYVPRFFAAAIVGENPEVFGLQMRPLSSY